MSEARPVVALLTDFGTADHYVASMKGALLSVCPDVTLVDISHQIPPQDVLAAALELAACFRSFPAGTIFLAVVDPGVGTSRRGLAAEAGGYRFVAPDNGLLTAVFRDVPPSAVVSLTDTRFRGARASRTFEGRDRFAPAAGWLAAGTPVGSMGEAVADPVALDIPVARRHDTGIIGCVLRVDRFGNLITNIRRDDLAALPDAGSLTVHAGQHRLVGIAGTYAETAADAICAIVGSTDHLEIAVNGGSAAERLGLGIGAPVEVVSLSKPVVP